MLSIIHGRVLLHKGNNFVLNLAEFLMPDFKIGQVKSWWSLFSTCISMWLVDEIDLFLCDHFLEFFIDGGVVKGVHNISVELFAELLFQLLDQRIFDLLQNSKCRSLSEFSFDVVTSLYRILLDILVE